MTEHDFDNLVAAAMARFDAMTSEEQDEERRRQRESWVRGEMAIGLDADERKWREEHGL